MNGYYDIIRKLLTAPHDPRRKYKTWEESKNVIKLA